ncbi:hypothetical protein D3C77_590940 [compost metagenome]
MQAHAERGEDFQADRRVLLKHAAVLRAVQAGDQAGLERRGADRIQRGAAKQQRLGKRLARTHHLDQFLLTVADHPVQLDLPAEQEIEAVGLVALME